MKKNEIKDKIKQIIHSVIEVEITDDDDLFEQGLNSINIIEIIVKIEDEFDIEFDEENLSFEYLKSLSSICKYVNSKLD